MSPAQRFLLLEVAFLAGVAFSNVPVMHTMAITIVLACFSLALLWWRPRSIAALGVFALLIGIIRPMFAGSLPSLLRYADTTVRFSGIVAEEVDRRLDQQKLVVTVHRVEKERQRVPASGRILVSTGLFPEYAYGDELNVRCRLERPEVIDSFAYDRYLALSNIFTLCRRPHISVVSPGHGLAVVRVLLKAKEWLLTSISERFGEPQASLLGGLLVGARRGIPSGILSAFQRTGLTHIIALSGFNITILAAATFAFAIRLGLHRRHAFWAVLIVLVAFLVLTGAPSSVLRACVMGMTMLLARRLGRPGNIWYALVFAATAMVAVNPSILIDDVGFQLSFLATLGLVVLSGRMEPVIRFLPSRFGIREAAGAALAATAFTLPLTMTKFGFVSFVAPVANIFVVPFIPVTMLAGFLSVLPVVSVFAVPAASILLTWIVWVPETLARLPIAGASVDHVPMWIAPACYGVVVLLTFHRRFIILLRQWPHLSKRGAASSSRASLHSS